MNSIISRFNEICTDLPKVKKLSDSRKRKIKSFLNEFSENELISIFEKAQASDFLSGRKTDWQANFDWLINKNNAVKVLEGAYDNKAAPKANASDQVFVKGDLPF